MTRDKILKKLDTMVSYEDKISYLNSLFLKATKGTDENMLLDIMEQLRKWGK